MDDDKADDIKIRDYLALLNECVKGFGGYFYTANDCKFVLYDFATFPVFTYLLPNSQLNFQPHCLEDWRDENWSRTAKVLNVNGGGLGKLN